jgi:peptide/nickel transport system substrate-binding protein
MQTQKPPFTDKRVRQALTWAVPYEEIQKNVYFGLSSQLRGPLTQVTPGADPSLWPYSQNFDRARALLQDAGLGSGFQTELTYPIGLPEDEPMMLLLQSAFRQIGVDARLDKVTPAGLSEKVFTYNYQMGLTHGGANNPDPYYAFFLFYHGDSQQNVSRWGTPESNQLIYDGLASQDMQARLQATGRIQQIVIDEAPYLNMAEPGVHVPMRDNVFGAMARMNRVIRYADLEKR